MSLPPATHPLSTTGRAGSPGRSLHDWQHICDLTTRLQRRGDLPAKLALAALTSMWLAVTMWMAVASRDSDRCHAWMLLGFGLMTTAQGHGSSAALLVHGEGRFTAR